MSYSTTATQENQRPCSEKTKVYNGTAKNQAIIFHNKRAHLVWYVDVCTGQPANSSPSRSWMSPSSPLARDSARKAKVRLLFRGRSSLVVKVSDRDWLNTSSSPVPLKTRRVGE
ncbi:hypothetical protein TNCV_4792031 [Trichonephila clavipes]|nr:hypothetical protein TNCV_4792031 [Trichonephila clavipes]